MNTWDRDRGEPDDLEGGSVDICFVSPHKNVNRFDEGLARSIVILFR